MGARRSDTLDPETVAVYDGDAAGYAEFADRTSSRDWVRRFIAELPAGGSVLDFGCGGGWASVDMIAAGLSVRAIDASEALVAEARALGVPAEVALFEDLADEDAYDGVWACYSLLHSPRATFPDSLARIRRALRPGGLLYIGMKEGEGERRDALGRRYAYVTEPELRGLLADAGFDRIEAEREVTEGFDGTPAPSLNVLAR